MSSSNINAVRPVAATPHKMLAGATFAIRKLVGGDRFKRLTTALADAIFTVNVRLGHKAQLLDYGCGNMAVGKSLQQKGLLSDILYVDTYELPPAQLSDQTPYVRIDGERLDLGDRRFDAAIVVDVLHHAGIENSIEILKDLASHCRYLVIKDHFEHGYYSRQMLRLADWFGNAAYDVTIPQRYFSQETWRHIVQEAGLNQIKLRSAVKIHDGLFGVMMPSKFHYISILKCS